MFLLNRTEQIHLRILIAIVMLSGILYLFLAPRHIHLKDAVVNGNNQIDISMSPDNGEIKILEVKQQGKVSPNRVILNKSNMEDLMCCPGIGRQKASAIIEERKKYPFQSWEDFQNRIKGISTIQVQILKDAGVRIDSPVQEITDL